MREKSTENVKASPGSRAKTSYKNTRTRNPTSSDGEIDRTDETKASSNLLARSSAAKLIFAVPNYSSEKRGTLNFNRGRSPSVS